MQSSPEDVEKILEEFKNERKEIERSIVEICFFMRGSISWNEAWNLTSENIKSIRKQITKNIETVNKTGLPII